MKLSISSRAGQYLLLILIVLSISFSTLVLHLPLSPRYEGLSPDSGLFAYTGQQILAGRLLYKDVWDEKPPGVYYVNAMALYFAGETPWAIWWLGLIWIALAGAALYLFMNKLVGLVPGLLSAVIFLLMVMYPDYYQKGNFTEVYALLPQVLAIGIFLKFLSSGCKTRWLFVLGITTAAAFLMKPTYIALGVTTLLIALYLDLRQRSVKRAVIHLLTYALGLAIPLGAIGLYLASKGTFQDMWYAVFTYNFQYAKQGFSLGSLRTTAIILAARQPMATVFAASIISMLIFLIKNKEKLFDPYLDKTQLTKNFDGNSQRIWVFASIFVALPLEWIFVSLSGKNFGHYFLTPLPAMAASCAYLFYEIQSARPRMMRKDTRPLLLLALIVVLFIPWFYTVVVKETPSISQLASLWEHPLYGSYEPNELTQYIIDNTKQAETVLIWSNHPGLNFLTNRRSPTRYAFILPLLMSTPDIQDRYVQFIHELDTNLPVLILAQPNSSAGIPFFDEKEENICPGCSPAVRAGLLTFKNYIDEHYQLAKEIYDWKVYKRIN
jgi:4-amino-4-deoxy-L-arabinose transferase-like glycosyltransferase